MSCYISSNANRLYTAVESAYGNVPAITASHRFPAVKLTTRQQNLLGERRDKTGSRTFAGVPVGTRRQTTFELRTYMTGWNSLLAAEPGYGPLFRAALGDAPLAFTGGTVAAGSTASQLVFAATHGLAPGQAVVHGSEVRFVNAVVNATTVQLNAPLSVTPATGAPIKATVTYVPRTDLASASIYDYWNPATAVQRILNGSAIDQLQLTVNGDFHEFVFSGAAQDIIDSVSFASGQGGLTSYPGEPAAGVFDYSIIPGHLGQVWLGTTPDRFYTVTSATFLLDNDIDLRAREFGSSVAKCIAPGRRSMQVSVDLFEQDDGMTKALYQAARQQSPIPMMFQLGQQAGQLAGIHMPSVVPEVPDFDDGDRRLQWRFRDSRAQGTIDDEVAIAFG
ncbi:MAG: hypothetical protein ACRD96_13530 [Bryobacteraceae bacterium]